jgi:transcriptional regulator with XRE-family HTH domain
MIREAIKGALKAQGISQRQIAEELGFDKTAFNAFLRGRRPFPVSDIEKLLKRLKIALK